jgi:hypothetical protein
MANELTPKVPVEDSKVDGLDLHPTLVEAADIDSFDEVFVPGDALYVDPDNDDPAAGLIYTFDTIDGTLLPTTSIIPSTITKTRKVLADGTVVYDIRFNVTDIGADSYEVAYVKR